MHALVGFALSKGTKDLLIKAGIKAAEAITIYAGKKLVDKAVKKRWRQAPKTVRYKRCFD